MVVVQDVEARRLPLEKLLKKRLLGNDRMLNDVDDNGHCQFDAIAHQVRLPPSLPSVC